jgi:hypothetical protein
MGIVRKTECNNQPNMGWSATHLSGDEMFFHVCGMNISELLRNAPPCDTARTHTESKRAQMNHWEFFDCIPDSAPEWSEKTQTSEHKINLQKLWLTSLKHHQHHHHHHHHRHHRHHHHHNIYIYNHIYIYIIIR